MKLLFTAGMTLVDSVDSILMLYSYSGFPEKSWALFEKAPETPPRLDVVPDRDNERVNDQAADVTAGPTPPDSNANTKIGPEQSTSLSSGKHGDVETDLNKQVARDTVVKMNVMSGLSIALTLMSILVAFRYANLLFPCPKLIPMSLASR